MTEKWAKEAKYNFIGGVNKSVSPFVQGEDEVTYVENGTAEKIGALSKRKGFSIKGNTAATTSTSTSSSTSTSTSTSTTA